MGPDEPGTPDRTEGAPARAIRFLGMAPERRIRRGPAVAVANIAFGIGMIGGGALSASAGGPLTIVLLVPLGLAISAQAVSDLLVGRRPRAVVALRALSVPAFLIVLAGWAWLALVWGGWPAVLAIASGFAAFGALAHALKRADARGS